MNQLAKEWIEYLKTNPKKCRGSLQDDKKAGSLNLEDKGRCCLGHALYVIHKNAPDLHLSTINQVEGSGGYLALKKVLGDKAVNLLGLHAGNGRTFHTEPLRCPRTNKYLESNVSEKIKTLAVLNDCTDFNHKEIAEIIEHNQDILFKEEDK